MILVSMALYCAVFGVILANTRLALEIHSLGGSTLDAVHLMSIVHGLQWSSQRFGDEFDEWAPGNEDQVRQGFPAK